MESVPISKSVLKNRLRNRIIENLDMFADESCVEKLGTDEIINCWYDIVSDNNIDELCQPEFSKLENESILSFHTLLEATYKDIPSTYSSVELKNNENWQQLKNYAQQSLDIFAVNGLSAEE